MALTEYQKASFRQHIHHTGQVINPDTGVAVEPVENVDGVVMMKDLPTADPHVVGQVWNSAGTLKVSAGA